MVLASISKHARKKHRAATRKMTHLAERFFIPGSESSPETLFWNYSESKRLPFSASDDNQRHCNGDGGGKKTVTVK